ncbi:hypothetical protein MKW94_019307 [Papaver nudicaule]|uniref:Uncharacterized protein n=1 Tax=Papaver nudicaule TaxID=74823 RepID=A0AA41V1D2_PAPNU|nr:hypothetical protein [Papaver nudicaule]
MKRKKWTEAEEETLINKYSDLLNSGTLPKLKTREKKFQPIADQVNSLHNLQDPISFPFRWSWRDVSIKVQNMRHQYLGVKQKIRVSDDEFNWNDAIDHWVNFFKYKDVFGDIELLDNNNVANYLNRRSFISDDEDEDEDGEEEEEEEECNGVVGVASDCKDWDGIDDRGGERREEGDSRLVKRKRLKKQGLGFLGTQLLELRDVIGKREERERKRRFIEEEKCEAVDDKVREIEIRNEDRMRDLEERMEVRELEWEERQRAMDKREMERRIRVEREFEEGRRRWLMKMEEKREEEEMGFKERMIQLQIEHEKQIMQMNVEACQNQMQVLGALVRVVCQFFGSGNDGIGSISTPHQDHLHPGNLVGDDNGKPDGNSNSHHFM